MSLFYSVMVIHKYPYFANAGFRDCFAFICEYLNSWDVEYIIRVNEFIQVVTTPIEEWLDYLKNNRIKDDTSTPGLQEAREKLLYMTMSDADCRAYDAYMDDILVQNDVFYTAKLEGLEQGRAEGHEEGHAEAIWAIARNELCCARSYYKRKSCSYIS